MTRKKSKPLISKSAMDFTALVAAIRRVHEQSASAVNRVVNTSLTMRNWLIGNYIHHYELHGADRAKYGARLVEKLADALQIHKIPATDRQRLYGYLSFYRVYPQIAEVIPPDWTSPRPGEKNIIPNVIVRTLTGKSSADLNKKPIVRTVSVQLGFSGKQLLTRLSYSHLEQLFPLEDSLKRAFYEIECIHGNWSVRTLKRQIATLYFERSGLSTNKKKLAAMVHAAAEQVAPKLAIRDPMIFEFLGLNPKEAISESDLESALLDNLQEFLLELGHGFCLEARQKSIIIGQTRGFVDLVFYNRVLKCHILVELKVDKFTHEHLGQLNTYVNWYRKNMMAKGDNPPVGILLCTQKDHALVEYALTGVDNRLFVSKYLLELPSKEDLQRFLEEKRREVDDGG